MKCSEFTHFIEIFHVTALGRLLPLTTGSNRPKAVCRQLADEIRGEEAREHPSSSIFSICLTFIAFNTGCECFRNFLGLNDCRIAVDEGNHPPAIIKEILLLC